VGVQSGGRFIDINRKVAEAIEGAQFLSLEEAMVPSNRVSPKGFNREVLTFLRERRSERRKRL